MAHRGITWLTRGRWSVLVCACVLFSTLQKGFTLRGIETSDPNYIWPRKMWKHGPPSGSFHGMMGLAKRNRSDIPHSCNEILWDTHISGSLDSRIHKNESSKIELKGIFVSIFNSYGTPLGFGEHLFIMSFLQVLNWKVSWHNWRWTLSQLSGQPLNPWRKRYWLNGSRLNGDEYRSWKFREVDEAHVSGNMLGCMTLFILYSNNKSRPEFVFVGKNMRNMNACVLFGVPKMRADLLIFFSMSLCRCFPTVSHWNKIGHFLAIIFERSTVACELRLCRDEPAHLHSSSLTPWPLGVAGTFRVSAKSLWCYSVFYPWVRLDRTRPARYFQWRIIGVEWY